MNGWKKLGGDATYHVEGDMIVGTTAPVHDTTNSFLVTKKFYDNFILEFEVILDVAPDNYHNSGVQIRSNSLPEYRNGRVHGYQEKSIRIPQHAAVASMMKAGGDGYTI